MSESYHIERDKKELQSALKISENFPVYLKQYFSQNPFHPANTTLNTYAYDIKEFLEYETRELPKIEKIVDIPISVFQNITSKDLDEYRRFLEETCKKAREEKESVTVSIASEEGNTSENNISRKLPLSNNIIRRKLASLSSLFTWMRYEGLIVNDPMRDMPRPKYNDKDRIISLDGSQSKMLLDGVLSGDKMVEKIHKQEVDGHGNMHTESVIYKVVERDEKNKIQHDRFIFRDYAMISLFLGTGIRVSELVGLNLEDVFLSDHRIHIWRKGNQDDDSYLMPEVESALRQYIYGSTIPLRIRQEHAHINEIYAYMKKHTYSPSLFSTIKEQYDDGTDTFDRDMQTLWRTVRLNGRQALRPKPNEHALFISAQGKRISVRMVENVVKESVLCYVPEFSDAALASPHKLRASAALRALRQFDLSYAQQMLHHRSASTTSRFYSRYSDSDMQSKTAKSSLTEY